MTPRVIPALCLAMLVAVPRNTGSQTYNLKVSVDEVELIFHATDTNGLSVNDLRLDELRLLDNGHPPRRIIRFDSLRDLPIRAGILLDTSSSMQQNRPADLAIATAYVQHILDRKTDQAFIMSFGQRSRVRQAWSNSSGDLTTAIDQSGIFPSTTAIFDSIYAACRDQFSKLGNAATGNFILLFSDGEDDASYLSIQTAVDMCQQAHTSIYTFRADPPDSLATGVRTLSQLANLTGGHVFRDSASPSEVDEDLRIIQANLRNQYRLAYSPAKLTRDGSFHSIVLLPPDRVATISARFGYYAPAR